MNIAEFILNIIRRLGTDTVFSLTGGMASETAARAIYLRLGLHRLADNTLLPRLVRCAARTLRQVWALLRRPREDNLRIRRSTEQKPQGEIRHILLIKPDHIGDLTVALPAIARLTAHFAEAGVTLLCNPVNADFARASLLFTRVITAPLDLRRRGTTTAERQQIIASLAALPHADIAIDLKIEAGSRWLLDHVRADLRVGFHDGGAIWNEPNTLALPSVLRNTNMSNGDLLALLVNATIGHVARAADIETTRNLLHAAANKVGSRVPQSGERLIGIAPGAGQSVKFWPSGHFVTLCRALQRRHNARIVLFGTDSESPLTAEIAAHLAPERLHDMTGRLSLPEFIGAASRLDLFIGLDTGSTHIAAGLGTKTICLFPAVTLQSRWLPRGPELTVIVNDVSCRVCGLREMRDCPNGHLCMTHILPETVLQEAAVLLA